MVFIANIIMQVHSVLEAVLAILMPVYLMLPKQLQELEVKKMILMLKNANKLKKLPELVLFDFCQESCLKWFKLIKS